MLAMIAMLTSGSSMMCWLHADRYWIREQLEQGGSFVLSYLLSIVTPIFFVALSLHCFMFAGFASQSMICRAVTALWLAIYAVNVGTILMEAMWKYMRQASITLDNISGFQFVPCFTRGLYSVSGAQAVRAHGSHTNFEIAPSL
ncbi:hypothetical protein EV424DRAFT_418407 [Suillus variegatus]|nr:hypothetical protein EV424DRAFT_418407 [Suillus variegatus]